MNYYIKQIGEKDCGFTSLKILLANIHKDKNYLFYPEFEKEYSLSLKNIIDIAKKENVILEGYVYDNKEKLFQEKQKYSLVILENNSKLHMVFVKKITKHFVLILDPEYGKIKYTKKEFLKYWNGQILIVKSYLRKKFAYKRIKKNPFYNVLTSILVVIAHVLLLTSLYFVKSSNNFLMPLLIFLSYLLFNLFIENLIINIMYRFDNKIKSIIKNRNNDKYKTYCDLQQYKVNYFVRNIQITNLIMNFLSLTFILGINSYLNICAILFILFFKLTISCCTKNLKKKKVIELNYLENSFKNDKNFDLKKYNLINKNSYFILKIEEFIKVITIAIIFFITILLTSFQKTISLNFLLFHFFAFLFLNETLDKIFNFLFDEKDLKYYQNLYQYYDNNY